ncbi:hypothetical protein D1164_10955 [Mariniphaga sediminis]|uniref:Uncharacterized protein n=1 Tax=Mariniphaga sediminis TaxID=1628158 RepID=A0A399D1N9_9BACT|nr:hypothetical protein [Mariniphaga sediminis]RIH65098.1 hypothetical protein D1164_10955 [Mariniphaga sediminis]
MTTKKKLNNNKKNSPKISMKSAGIILSIIAIAMIIGISYLGQIADKSRENARETIKKYGTEVECRLTYKYETESNRIHHYFLVIDIQYNDSIIKLESQSFDFDSEDFEKAIIGLKYKTLVTLEGENKFKYSKILLDKPIIESYSNVYEEREDIKARYKGAAYYIKKYGRTGKELDEIWEKYYK